MFLFLLMMIIERFLLGMCECGFGRIVVIGLLAVLELIDVF